jgi:hypothetical protein
LIERYSRALGGEEHVFDFSERPNTGILAAAAWKSGFLSLEEFAHGKHVVDDEYGNGRCDLWIATDDVRYQWFVEAKHCYTSINRKEIIEGVRPKLNAALSDAIRSTQFEDGIGVGICFTSIYDLSKNIEDRTDNIEQLISELQSMRLTLGYDAIAWSFPKEARQYQPEEQQHGRLGIVLIAKQYKCK